MVRQMVIRQVVGISEFVASKMQKNAENSVSAIMSKANSRE